MLTAAAVILLLVANAFFVAAEFALVKVRGIRLEALAADGSNTARMTLRMLPNIEAYLAACQLGITMASLGLGWVGEPAVAAILEPIFRMFGMSEAVLHTIAFLTGFLIFSSLHIVVGEQVPKTFAIRKPEPMATWLAWPLHAFYILCFPLNWALNKASRAILHWLRVEEASHIEVFSGEELKGLIDVSHEHGEMHRHDRHMLSGVLDLNEVEVGEIMTHRKEMAAINADRPVVEIIGLVESSPYTRYPVWRGDPDSIIGVLHAKDLLLAVCERSGAFEDLDIAELLSPPWFIPDTTPIGHQLIAFRHQRAHLALVVDEYGALMGLVTLEDIVEEIVGDIVDEKDVETAGVQVQKDGSIVVQGRVTVRDLNRQFDWDLPDDEAATIAGLVIHEAQRIPEVGQTFSFYGFHVEVRRRQRNQITLLRIVPPPAEPIAATA